MADENIRKLAETSPNWVTKKHDYDQLKQELSEHIVDGSQERYHLSWSGKDVSLLPADAPIAKTLRPVRDDNVDFDITQNLLSKAII